MAYSRDKRLRRDAALHQGSPSLDIVLRRLVRDMSAAVAELDRALSGENPRVSVDDEDPYCDDDLKDAINNVLALGERIERFEIAFIRHNGR